MLNFLKNFKIQKILYIGVNVGFAFSIANTNSQTYKVYQVQCAENYLWIKKQNDIVRNFDEHKKFIEACDLETAHTYVESNLLYCNKIKDLFNEKKHNEFNKIMLNSNSYKQTDNTYYADVIKWLEKWGNMCEWNKFLHMCYKNLDSILLKYVIVNHYNKIEPDIVFSNPNLTPKDFELYVEQKNYVCGMFFDSYFNYPFKLSSKIFHNDFVQWIGQFDTQTRIEFITKYKTDDLTLVELKMIIESDDIDLVSNHINYKNFHEFVQNNMIAKSPNQIKLFDRIYSKIFKLIKKYPSECYDNSNYKCMGIIKKKSTGIVVDECEYYYYYLNNFIAHKNYQLIEHMLKFKPHSNSSMYVSSIELAFGDETNNIIFKLLVSCANTHELCEIIKKLEQNLNINSNKQIQNKIVIAKEYLSENINLNNESHQFKKNNK